MISKSSSSSSKPSGVVSVAEINTQPSSLSSSRNDRSGDLDDDDVNAQVAKGGMMVDGAVTSPKATHHPLQNPFSVHNSGDVLSSNASIIRSTTVVGGGDALHVESSSSTMAQLQQQLDQLTPAGPDKSVYVCEYFAGKLQHEQALSQEDLAIIFGPVQQHIEKRRRRLLLAPGRRRRRDTLLGETIYKGHRSYDLMLNLQLGIRYTITQLAKLSPPTKLTDKHFSEKLWLRFPRSGSSVTPPHPSNDFKWKDYCPTAFRAVRQVFGINSSEFLLSICGDQALRELPSSGKSGSVFFLSHDDRFIIKTMRKEEMKLLLAALPKYAAHVMANPDTLLVRFYGVHRVKPRHGAKVRFVVMNNIFRTDLEIHRKYDLKGSTIGRTVMKSFSSLVQGNGTDVDDEGSSGKMDNNYKKKKNNNNNKVGGTNSLLDLLSKEKELTLEPSVLKDLDVDVSFKLDQGYFKKLMSQLKADAAFLADIHVMDYSLLMGVHFKAMAAGGIINAACTTTGTTGTGNDSAAPSANNSPETAKVKSVIANMKGGEANNNDNEQNSKKKKKKLGKLKIPAAPADDEEDTSIKDDSVHFTVSSKNNTTAAACSRSSHHTSINIKPSKWNVVRSVMTWRREQRDKYKQLSGKRLALQASSPRKSGSPRKSLSTFLRTSSYSGLFSNNNNNENYGSFGQLQVLEEIRNGDDENKINIDNGSDGQHPQMIQSSPGMDRRRVREYSFGDEPVPSPPEIPPLQLPLQSGGGGVTTTDISIPGLLSAVVMNNEDGDKGEGAALTWRSDTVDLPDASLPSTPTSPVTTLFSTKTTITKHQSTTMTTKIVPVLSSIKESTELPCTMTTTDYITTATTTVVQPSTSTTTMMMMSRLPDAPTTYTPSADIDWRAYRESMLSQSSAGQSPEHRSGNNNNNNNSKNGGDVRGAMRSIFSREESSFAKQAIISGGDGDTTTTTTTTPSSSNIEDGYVLARSNSAPAGQITAGLMDNTSISGFRLNGLESLRDHINDGDINGQYTNGGSGGGQGAAAAVSSRSRGHGGQPQQHGRLLSTYNGHLTHRDSTTLSLAADANMNMLQQGPQAAMLVSKINTKLAQPITERLLQDLLQLARYKILQPASDRGGEGWLHHHHHNQVGHQHHAHHNHYSGHQSPAKYRPPSTVLAARHPVGPTTKFAAAAAAAASPENSPNSSKYSQQQHGGSSNIGGANTNNVNENIGNREAAASSTASAPHLGYALPASVVPRRGTDGLSLLDIHGDETVLYFGIIDFLQKYNLRKRVEHGVKSVVQDGRAISVVEPKAYAKRFLSFLNTIFLKKGNE